VIVLDASALIDIVVGRRHAAWLLEQLAEAELVAPAHQPAEVLSAIGRLERAGALAADDASTALESAMSLPQTLVTVDLELSRRAFELRGRIRLLDGLYVALAERMNGALLTTDARLIRSAPPCEVLAPPD